MSILGGPSAIWSSKLIVFDTDLSLSQNVILTHGKSSLQAIVNRVARLYAVLGAEPDSNSVFLNPEISQLLSEICFHQGVASQILFNDSARSSSESKSAFDMRLERVGYVNRYCAEHGVLCPVLTNRKVRNSLVHIDEYLEKALKAPNTGWWIDCAMGSRNAFDPPPGLVFAYCRTFISSEHVLLHLGNEYSLRDLVQESIAVLAAVFGVDPTIYATELTLVKEGVNK